MLYMSFSETRESILNERLERRREMAAIGVDEALIERMVDTFYDRVRADDHLGPIFAATIRDWPPHLAQMKRFWRSILLTTGEFHGSPVARHAALQPLTRSDFDHWLSLFAATLDDVATPPARDHILTRARSIAASLSQGIARARLQEN